MHRSRILYAIPLSLVMSGEAFAADQNAATELPPRSGTKKASSTGTQARTIEKLEVRARRASTLASSATKSDTPLIETAQSVTVITRNEMDIRNVLNLNQAVRYTAGITADLRGGGVGT
ncbi:MAG: TonB-dependent receptor plug domain-containing protein, partial [Gluconobacter potus]